MKVAYVINIIAVVSFAVSIPLFWNALIPVIGTVKRLIGKRRQSKTAVSKMNHFAVITCARNEAKVIGKLIDSLKAQNYPDELYDIFVIADNCTDSETERVSKLHGAMVFNRFDKTKVGKGYALKWGFEKIFSLYPDKYDAVCIFDADNLADKNFLSVMNDALNSGSDGVQGMRISSNAYDSVVSGCYEIYWMMINHFQNLARYELGMSCLFSGTGFVLKSEYVKDGGWETDTITEDTEFSVESILKGRHIAIAEKAVFYDEQPTEWRVSMTQRFRWMFGAMQCAMKLFDKSFGKRMKGHMKFNIHTIDVYLWLLSLPAMAIMLFLKPAEIILSLLSIDCFNVGVISAAFSVISLPIISIFSCVLILCFKRSLKKMWKSAFLYPIFILPMAFMALASIFKKKLEWKPVRHKNTKSFMDMKL